VRLPCHTDAVSCTFNRDTLLEHFKRSNKCPTCSHVFAFPGPQPAGRMMARREGEPCSGHERAASIHVHFNFPPGVQAEHDPDPNQPYNGTRRDCYYPDDAVGWTAVALLRAGFHQGLLFRVGTSATTGHSSTVVWSVHQKTNRHGGPTQHGWPDGEYLLRLKSELVAAGLRVLD